MLLPERPLLSGRDHGPGIEIRKNHLGLKDDRWVEPFLAANRPALDRLDLRPEVRADPLPHVVLVPGSRVGAAPLLSPATHKVVSGLLIEPRFAWTALGSVCASLGFEVEPQLGSGPLVPGSQRQVPPWVIAAPVLRRLEALALHSRRGFVEVSEERAQPRGRVDWSAFARGGLGRGQWDRLPCTFSEPMRDPELLANARWTLQRVVESLLRWSDSGIARGLVGRAETVAAALGEGPARRPTQAVGGRDSAWVVDAVEAMGWVSEERGLGGGRVLDGLAWDLAIDQVWERWVRSLAKALAPRLGMVGAGEVRFPLRWQGRADSMSALVPDVVLRGRDRVVVIDAKYKAHFQLLARHGWRQQSEAVREAHRSDLHQALAYASLHDVDRTDVVLAYPSLTPEGWDSAGATIVSGRRSIRLWLMELPFGFASPEVRTRHLERWATLLGTP